VERGNFQDQEGDGKDVIKLSLRDLAFDNESPSQDWIQWALLMFYEINDVAGCGAVLLGE
jgi:hypothetical protein